MAKIKLQGHASGTGVVTVTAPNTSTDRTITLPDATGTLLNSDGSAANLTAIPAANITGTLPAISGANLTGVRDTTGGRKNIFINGDFSVNQRGTGATSGGTYLTADRWKAGQTNVTFQTVANDRDLSIANMLKVTANSSGYGIIVQAVEDVRTASGQNVTLSFWAKTANFSSLRLELQQNFGSGGSATVTVVNNASYFSVPNTGWNKYTATIAMPSISGKTVGTSSSLNMALGANSGTNAGIVYFSEIQLELGSVATDFEHRSYGEELALCQRYYQRLGGRQYESVAAGKINDANDCNVIAHFPQTMRAIPSIIIGTLSDWIQDTPSGAKSFTSISNYLGVSGGTLNTVGSAGMTAGQATTLRVNADNSYIGLDSEL